MIQRQTLRVDGSEMTTLSAFPEGDGPHPVYLECFHAPGQDAFTEAVLERWAANGYAAFSHDLFHRQGPGAKGSEAMKHLVDEEMIRDTRALVDHVRGIAACDTARMAIGGHCMGGRVALLCAAALGGFRAVGDFWGGGVATAKGREAPTVLDMVGSLACPVIGFFGNDDTNPSPADVDQLDQTLTRHQVPHRFHRYDGAGHAFQNFVNPDRYREGPAKDAWEKVIAFFDATVK